MATCIPHHDNTKRKEKASSELRYGAPCSMAEYFNGIGIEGTAHFQGSLLLLISIDSECDKNSHDSLTKGCAVNNFPQE